MQKQNIWQTNPTVLTEVFYNNTTLVSQEDVKYESFFKFTVARSATGRYVVSLHFHYWNLQTIYPNSIGLGKLVNRPVHDSTTLSASRGLSSASCQSILFGLLILSGYMGFLEVGHKRMIRQEELDRDDFLVYLASGRQKPGPLDDLINRCSTLSHLKREWQLGRVNLFLT